MRVMGAIKRFTESQPTEANGSTVLYRKALAYARAQIQPNRAFYGMERIHNAIRGKRNTYFLWFSIPFMFY